MKRIICHWTAGSYTPNILDRVHYHFLIDGEGKVVNGQFKPEDNLDPQPGHYAAHTLNANTGAIGVAVCCMGKAKESPFDTGPWPMKIGQWQTMVNLVADLCLKYDIPVTPETVLTHAEVQTTLKIPQRGKWDIARLSFNDNIVGAAAVGAQLRLDVTYAQKAKITSRPATPDTPKENVPMSTSVTDWFLQRAKAMVATVAAGLLTAGFQYAETKFGIKIDVSIQASIIGAVTGLLVERVPNKKPA